MDETHGRILIVDDDAGCRIGLAAVLTDIGYETNTACDGVEALAQLQQHSFDLVVSDVSMPRTDGFDLVRQVRRASTQADLPIILLSAAADTDRKVTGLSLGADDFMAKPVDVDELIARIQTQLRHLRRSRELRQQGRLDELTGVLNRRGILEVLDRELKRASRTQAPISLLMIDLDAFKGVNDTRGHAAGDEVLRHVATALRGGVRAYDCVGRMGGDEFLVILPATDAPDAVLLAHRLREVAGQEISVSVGASTSRGSELADVLIRRADDAMYLDKNRGNVEPMKYVKFALMGFGVLGAILSLVYGVMAAGVHGVIVLVGCLLPVALGAMSIVTRKGMPRWASAVSLVALLIVGMKTTEGDDLQNIMMAAAAGMICAIILLIKPDTPADANKSARSKATLRN